MSDQLTSVQLLARRVITSSVLENILIQAPQKSEFLRLYSSFLIPLTSGMFYNTISTSLLLIFGKNYNFQIYVVFKIRFNYLRFDVENRC